MKLVDGNGCLFNDRIDVELSPSQLEELIEMARKRAMSEDNYDFAGLRRELKDLLQERYNAWREERNKKDNP